MNIKNYAIFGLFANEEMINNGSIQSMENEAVRIIISGQIESLRISVYGFKGDTIIEGTPILAIRKVEDSIIIANMLLKEETKDETTYSG